MTAIVLATSDKTAHTRHWADLTIEERRRRALHAIQERDREALNSLIEGFLVLKGRKGANVSPATLKQMRVMVGSLLDFSAGQGKSLSQPHEDFGHLYMRWLEANGMAARSVQARVSTARRFYDALDWCGFLIPNPFNHVHAPKPTNLTPREGYTEDEVHAMLRVADDRERVAVLLGADTGLRCEEIVSLEWEDIHTSRREVRVVDGKGGKTNSVPMTQRLLGALAALRDLQGRPLYGPVIRSLVKNDRVTDDTLRRMIEALCTRAHVPYKGVHALRHTAGTETYRATRDLYVTQRVMRHSDIKNTTIYAQMDRDGLHNAVQAREARAVPSIQPSLFGE